jgi:DnaJ-class molecular chaperone
MLLVIELPLRFIKKIFLLKGKGYIKKMLNLDYYKVLGVSVKATPDDLKKAYRAAVKKYHPDLHKDEPQAHKKMSEVNEAYETLSNPNKRRQYDLKNGATRVINFTPPKQENRQNKGSASWKFEGEDLREEFESFFKGFGKQRTEQQAPTVYSSYYDNFIDDFRHIKKEKEQGKDLTKKLTLTEAEALLGTKKEIKVKRYNKCVHCRGRGTIWGYDGAKKCPICHGRGVIKNAKSLIITLPAGLRTGMRVHVTGQGDAGKQGRKDGALYLLITVKVKPQKKEQDERFTEVLIKTKELEKTYKKLAKKFASKTFLKNIAKFVGPDWAGIGKLYGEYATGKLEQEIKTLKEEGQTLKKGTPEQLTKRLKAFVAEVAGRTEEFQTELNLLKKSEEARA